MFNQFVPEVNSLEVALQQSFQDGVGPLSLEDPFQTTFNGSPSKHSRTPIVVLEWEETLTLFLKAKFVHSMELVKEFVKVTVAGKNQLESN